MARLNSSPIRQYRGTTAQHANYTGPSGELTVDTEKNTVVVQDGVTAGGHPMARDVDVVHLTGDEAITGVKTFGEVHNTMTSDPSDTEVVNVGYLKDRGLMSYDMPLYFDTNNGEYEWGAVHAFVPMNVTTVQLLAIEADGSGTSALTLTMAYDIGTSSSMTITSTATDCSAYAGRAVVFSVSGTSDQTEIAALLRFDY